MLSSPTLQLVGQKKFYIHPIVLCSIYDNFARRKENQTRIIGTLIGEHFQGTTIIKDCYTVPFSDDNDRVEVDIEFHQTMFELHHKINPADVIVGWWATGKESWSDDVVIHDFYSKNIVKKPVFLSVGTDIMNGGMSVKAFVQKKLKFGDTIVGYHFKKVALEYQSFNAEKIVIQSLGKGPSVTLAKEADLFAEDMKNLQTMLIEIEKYIKVNPDKNEVLISMLNEAFQTLQMTDSKILSEEVQDVKLIRDLSKQIQSHLVLTEKLQNSM